MARDLKMSNLGLRLKTGVVLPASETNVEEAITTIRAGKVITVPTDTLYGFTCDAWYWNSLKAVNRIYEIKGRKQISPLAICVVDVSDIKRFAENSSILENSLNLGLDGIGVRDPDSNFIRIITHGFGSALALTIANLSGQPSSVNINDFENLWQHCAYVYDGGLLPSGHAGSTVVDLTELGRYKILRPGRTPSGTEAAQCSSLVDGARCRIRGRHDPHSAFNTLAGRKWPRNPASSNGLKIQRQCSTPNVKDAHRKEENLQLGSVYGYVGDFIVETTKPIKSFFL
ncbi:hypothetical protein ACLOJK_011577 [Asimina triloba]